MKFIYSTENESNILQLPHIELPFIHVKIYFLYYIKYKNSTLPIRFYTTLILIL